MKTARSAIVQLAAVSIIGTVVAFTFNAFSVNGINPLRKTVEVPRSSAPSAMGAAS